MVKGQVRALGSKQHLKTRFGSGFELSIKLRIGQADVAQQVEALTAFVLSLFPSSLLLAENGGQVTYKVPKEEMNLGKVFGEMEGSKERLQVEDYMVAQPTLEQVCLRYDGMHSHSHGKWS
jgi:hypothetical protein